MPLLRVVSTCALGVALLLGATAFARTRSAGKPPRAPVTVPPTGSTPYLSARDELRTIELADGYRLELVLSEPDIREPVQVAFDGNGRMYVLEMRTYMQDIDGTNEHAPTSRVSRHESSRRDGSYDKHVVFRDGLVLPRMLLPLDDRVIIGETDTNDLFVYRDTNGDGTADEKTKFYEGGPRGGNLEHQPNGLLWSVDNWLYSTYNAYRLRWTPNGAVKEPTAPNGGQWGVAQDDFGKLWWSNAGGERGVLNFQTHTAYAAFDLAEQQAASFREVFPLVGLGDVEGGRARFRPEDRTLNHFTGTCGQTVYRGDRLPADLRGDVLLPEPVGRLVRRIDVQVQDGITTVRNAYDRTEFLRSTDPNFRPVNMTTAPDGTLYIVDMYRGIIQEGNWVRPGSHLRPMVEKHGLDRNVGRGRIWRLVHRSMRPGPQPRMLDETPARLVQHLAHPNGWWRDTAQKLLVLRGDRSVVPALASMARDARSELARLHALWTLEGLDALEPAVLRASLADPHPQVRVNAIRAAESRLKAHPEDEVRDRILALLGDQDPSVVIQVLATARRLRWPGHQTLIRETVGASASRGVRLIGERFLDRLDPAEVAGLAPAEVKRLEHGRAIYGELCFACHGDDGRGTPLQGGAPGATVAPPLRGSRLLRARRDLGISVLLHGMQGPVDGKPYAAAMVPMKDNDDAWVAAVLSYVRHGMGNRASLVSPEDVALVRARTAGRAEPWTWPELMAGAPTAVAGRERWKLSASHRTDLLARAIDDDAGSRWDTGTSQVPGMWFQIELPDETELTSVRLDAAPSYEDFPRRYEVRLSTDGRTWGVPVAAGAGMGPTTEIDFAAARARYVRITQTGQVSDRYWSIHDVRLMRPRSANSRGAGGIQ